MRLRHCPRASYDKEKGILGAGGANEERYTDASRLNELSVLVYVENNVRVLLTTEISPFLPQRQVAVLLSLEVFQIKACSGIQRYVET